MSKIRANPGPICCFCYSNCFKDDPEGQHGKLATCQQGLAVDLKQLKTNYRRQLNLNKKPSCPMCGRYKTVVVRRDGTLICSYCNKVFDTEDDGDIGYGSPDRRTTKGGRVL